VLILTMVVYPLSLYAYWNALSRSTAEGKLHVNYFEDGHALLPASEYLRGERAYRDILPAHGLLEDGFFDYLVFQTGDVNVGRALKAREVTATLMTIALYFLAWAVIGSAEGALLAVFLSIMMGVFTPALRMLPAIATLALIAGAVRWRKPRWFAYAAFGCVVCGITSLDFAAYTFATLIIAVARRRTGFSLSLAGIGAGIIPLFATFAILGILDDFLRGTFVEVLGVGPAYTLGFFVPPDVLSAKRFFPEVLAVLLERRGASSRSCWWPCGACSPACRTRSASTSTSARSPRCCSPPGSRAAARSCSSEWPSCWPVPPRTSPSSASTASPARRRRSGSKCRRSPARAARSGTRATPRPSAP
jgi:hypothetical protein